jgi:hypothetical protein
MVTIPKTFSAKTKNQSEQQADKKQHRVAAKHLD